MMKRVFSLALMSAAAPLFAATYYASPIGTSSAAGTEADPYDIATAIAKLGNNTYDDVYLLPGTYKVGSASLAAIDYYARLIGKGATRDDVVLDFEGAGTALKVQTGASVCNLTISNFVNCSAMEIINYNGYGELIVSNCVIRSGSGTKPGMTMTGAGPILVVDSVIRDIDGNISGGGYGVGVNCSAAGACFRRCTFANNTYTGWVGLGGAAGYFSAAALVENCIVSNNSATGYGGGFHTTTGMRIKDTLFIGNSSSANGGGAIYSQSGANNTNFIVGCTFIDNRTTVSSVKGGAIFAGFYNTLVSNCSFTANASLSNGGAIHCYDSATNKTIGIEIVGCGFTNNTASSGGSAITIGRRGAERIEPPFNIRNCHFKGNTNSANATGGGIQLYGFVQANVEDCDFEDNQAGVSSGEGGAIGRTNDAWNEAMARAVCRRCRFVNNRAAVGAAIAATASLYDCDFFGNIATNSNASGCNAIVYLYGKRLVAKEYLDEAFTNFVSGCHFEGNVVYGTTMGIMAPFGDFRCYDTTFSNNGGYTSHITGGWSVNLRAPTYFEVDRCQFVGNTAASSGSGFHCEKGTMNDSMTNGWVRNSLFHKNYSVTSGGAACGMIQLGWTNTWISGCTIVSNYIYGGIWAAVNTSCTQSNCVANCIMYMNDTNSGTQYRDVNGSADKQPYFHNCFISNGKFTDNGCLGKDQDPGFVDIASGNLQLRRDSVCVDKGDNEPWMFAGKIPDLAGRPRISGSSVDIGCYEYCPILRFILSIR